MQSYQDKLDNLEFIIDMLEESIQNNLFQDYRITIKKVDDKEYQDCKKGNKELFSSKTICEIKGYYNIKNTPFPDFDHLIIQAKGKTIEFVLENHIDCKEILYVLEKKGLVI